MVKDYRRTGEYDNAILIKPTKKKFAVEYESDYILMASNLMSVKEMKGYITDAGM